MLMRHRDRKAEMEQTDLERIEQQVSELDLIARAGASTRDLLHIIRNTAAEDVDRQIAAALNCTPPEARMIRHLPLDRFSPGKIARMRAELEELRQRYLGQGGV